MPKSLLLFLSLFFLNSPCWSSSLGELLEDVKEESRMTFLQGASPIFFYDWHAGEQKFGVATSIWNYRFISADIGYSTRYIADEKGTLFGGGSLHADRLLAQVFPTATEIVKAFLPNTSRKFFEKFCFGIAGGYNFETKTPSAGVFSGIEIQF